MKKLLIHVFGKMSHSARKPHTPRWRPRLETLEDRLTPATIQVTTLADVVNPLDGKVSLREAITMANATAAPDTILLMAGVHRIGLTGQFENANATGDFDITNPLTIVGKGAGASVVDAGRLDRVFDVLGAFNATFSKLTVRNGLTDNPTNGAGIHALDANLTLTGSIVTGNFGVNGGGVYARNGNVSVAGSRVTNNWAQNGGGIHAVNGLVTVTDSVVAGNTSAGNGGGINAEHGTVTLLRSTVASNRASVNGGGVHAGANFVFATGSLVRQNVAGQPGDSGVQDGQGGGIFCAGATLTGSIVRGNFAFYQGGGVFAFSGATLTRCTVSGNVANSTKGLLHAGYGGGVLAPVSVLTESTVSGNYASGAGGGVYAIVSATVTGSTFSGNTAGYHGGGLSASNLNLTNSTFSGNVAGAGRFGLGSGGGINGSRGIILNCTITENFATNGGGGLHWAPNADRIRVKNTIIAGNSSVVTADSDDVFGTFHSEGHNLIGVVNGSAGFGVAGDQVGTSSDPLDAMLGALAFNGGPTMTHALLAGSRAIDRGDNAFTSLTDQRGVARPRDGDGNGVRVVDIGAFER